MDTVPCIILWIVPKHRAQEKAFRAGSNSDVMKARSICAIVHNYRAKDRWAGNHPGLSLPKKERLTGTEDLLGENPYDKDVWETHASVRSMTQCTRESKHNDRWRAITSSAFGLQSWFNLESSEKSAVPSHRSVHDMPPHASIIFCTSHFSFLTIASPAHAHSGRPGDKHPRPSAQDTFLI